MRIPYTTRIDVLRTLTTSGSDSVDAELASYGLEVDSASEVAEEAAVVTGLRAHIGSPGGTEQIVGGDQEVVTMRMTCEPYDIFSSDRIRDQKTGIIYGVIWAVKRIEVPHLAHTQVALSRVRGGA